MRRLGITSGLFTGDQADGILTGYSQPGHRFIVIVGRRIHLAFLEQEDVAELFAPFGEVVSCALPLERDTGRKRGFAFVEMADDGAETKAIDALQGAELMGRPLRINKAEPRGAGGGVLSAASGR